MNQPAGQQPEPFGTSPYPDVTQPEIQPAQPWDPHGHYSYYGVAATPPAPPGMLGAPVPPAAPKRRRGLVAAGIAAVAAAAIFGAGVATGHSTTVVGKGNAIASAPGSSSGSSNGGSSGSSNGGSTTNPFDPNSGSGGSTTDPFGQYPFGGSGNGSANSGSTGQASSAQSVGVVDIYTELQYSGAAAAGTGVVLSSDGEILTNNHVINGATSIRVVVVSTGKSYTAKVVGTVPTRDIALIKLQNASGLKTANLGDSGSVKVGDAVTGVGNAGGSGGTPSAASGKVTALNQTITASDEDGSGAETLHGVIVTDAPIQAGDSGGPLYSSQNKVIGIDTAASTNGSGTGFAIPINTALSLVTAIKSGVQTSSVHIGYPGFMGVSIAQSQVSGAVVQSVVNGGPAADAGIAAGDVITKVGGTTITTPNQLQKAISSKDPGAKISLTYTDQNNSSHTVTVTLETGPAD